MDPQSSYSPEPAPQPQLLQQQQQPQQLPAQQQQQYSQQYKNHSPQQNSDPINYQQNEKFQDNNMNDPYQQQQFQSQNQNVKQPQNIQALQQQQNTPYDSQVQQQNVNYNQKQLQYQKVPNLQQQQQEGSTYSQQPIQQQKQYNQPPIQQKQSSINPQHYSQQYNQEINKQDQYNNQSPTQIQYPTNQQYNSYSQQQQQQQLKQMPQMQYQQGNSSQQLNNSSSFSNLPLSAQQQQQQPLQQAKLIQKPPSQANSEKSLSMKVEDEEVKQSLLLESQQIFAKHPPKNQITNEEQRPRSPKLPPISERKSIKKFNREVESAVYTDQNTNMNNVQSEKKIRVANLKQFERQLSAKKRDYLSSTVNPNTNSTMLNNNMTTTFEKDKRTFLGSNINSSHYTQNLNQNNRSLQQNNKNRSPQLNAQNNTTLILHNQQSIFQNSNTIINEKSKYRVRYEDEMQESNSQQDADFQPSGISKNQMQSQDLKELPVGELLEILKEGGITKQYQYKPDIYLFDGLTVDTKKFYQNRKDFLKIMTEFDITNHCMQEVNSRVKCYRCELGGLLEKVGNSFQFIMEKVLETTVKLYHETKNKFENQINENLDQIESLEKQKKQMEVDLRDIKNRYTIQESLLKITKINSDALQDEVGLLNEMLRKDVLSMINHIGTIEASQQSKIQTIKEDPSENIVVGLKNLNNMLTSIEQEQQGKETHMESMGNLIKAMLKGSKEDAYTQVDEAELYWNPNMIVIGDPQNNMLTREELEAMSIGINDKFVSEETTNQTNRDILLAKEKEFNVGGKKLQQSENWNLPVSIIIFLENIAKSNDQGRVIPWLHFRKLIYEIYSDLIENYWEIQGALNTTTLGFDEYVCLYFLKIHKLRRVAEMKLFEFLISLRYYVNTWPRAQHFALLCNISQCQVPQGEPAIIYKFDIYLQNYFQYIYSLLNEQQAHYIENDGFTYLPKQLIQIVVKDISVIYNEQIKQRIQTKIDKNFKKIQDKECVDIDKLVDIFIDEYFEVKKKVHKTIARNFSKANDNEHGVHSIDDIKKICKEIISEKSHIAGTSYPRDMTMAKLFMFSLTSNKNKFDVGAKDFMNSISKYGIDCPFPILRTQNKEPLKPKNKEETTSKKDKKNKDPSKQQGDGQAQEKRNLEEIIKDLQSLPTLTKEDLQPVFDTFNIGLEDGVQTEEEKTNLKIDATSTLFAQHFSILRELRNYCKSFKENLAKEENPDVLWTEFGNIMSILDAGCQFLNFPINI